MAGNKFHLRSPDGQTQTSVTMTATLLSGLGERIPFNSLYISLIVDPLFPPASLEHQSPVGPGYGAKGMRSFACRGFLQGSLVRLGFGDMPPPCLLALPEAIKPQTLGPQS